ncbi:MAG: hypothetical protein KatS3mg076_0625 [Candidatus Binatia bacterium]|nr:MAG: hypothetical protein KatS3mg076_0625 [Candidatus Binatia bacterium]
MEGEKTERGFKVEDRRRFTADGRPREEVSSTEEPAPGTSEGTEPRPEHRGEESGGTRVFGEGSRPSEITFQNFIVSLSTQALVLLGEMEDPVQGGSKPDLEGAKQLIDILAMLQKKTAGNLDEGESRLLDDMLYNLRMQFVKRVSGG